MGNVTKADFSQYKDIDLLIGGSPCTNFSMAGNRKGMTDENEKEILSLEQYLKLKKDDVKFQGESYLFWEFVRALKEVNPKYFLLENVKMKKKWQDVITANLGVEPIEINSNLVSAQNRKRLYWTNIPNIQQPEDKKIMLKDIVHETLNDNVDISSYIIPFDKTLQILNSEVNKRKIGYFGTDSQGNRIYSIHDKSATIVGQAGGKGAKTGLYLFGCITPERIEKRQDGQRFNNGDKFYTLTAQDRHGVLINGYIRKLTPIECERLQTLPDNYTNVEGIKKSNRYKAIGNGWTVDIIAHIFSFLPEEYKE